VPGYSYQLSDRLVKDQLWAAANVKSQNSVDVEFLLNKKKLFAHKAILAARSPVFAAEFAGEPQNQLVPLQNSKLAEMVPLPSSQQLISNNIPVKDAGPHQIRMDGVNPSTMEQFLHFIYTGEFTSTLDNEELLKLAEYYQLTTLIRLCKTALKKSDDALQMVSIVKSLHNECDDGTSPSPKIRFVLLKLWLICIHCC
jgi:speckle-type POZ protein